MRKPLVTVARALPSSVWPGARPLVDGTSLPPQRPAAKPSLEYGWARPPEAQALLNAIGEVEGSEYNRLYTNRYTLKQLKGYRTFDTNQPHPNSGDMITEGPYRGRQSTAAGRYQILKDTWDGLGFAGKPMTPENQDAAAWALAQQRYKRETRRDLLSDLQAGNRMTEVETALAKEWAALRGGATPNRTAPRFEQRYKDQHAAEIQRRWKASRPDFTPVPRPPTGY